MRISEEIIPGLISSFQQIVKGQNADVALFFLQAANWDLEGAIQQYFSFAYEEPSQQVEHFPPHVHPNSNSNGADDEELPDLIGVGQENVLSSDHVKDDEEHFPRDRPDLTEEAHATDFSADNVKDDREDNKEIDDQKEEGEDNVDGGDYNDEEGAYDDNDDHYDYPMTYDDSTDNTSYSPLFNGSFEDAKYAAKSQNKWLLVNVRLTFSGDLQYDLNTWSNEGVVRAIETSFVFWQVDGFKEEEGQKVRAYYKLESLPAVMVIDPITGQRMGSISGLIQPEDLLANLVLRVNGSPIDCYLNLSRKHGTSSQLVRDNENMEVDDDQLQSLEDGGDDHEDDYVKLPDYPPLPEEPNVNDMKLVCRVGVRLPDGRRIQRKFLRSDPIQLLWSFCCSELEEAALKPFQLAIAIPGSSKSLHIDSNLSFEESGLANCRLLFTWG